MISTSQPGSSGWRTADPACAGAGVLDVQAFGEGDQVFRRLLVQFLQGDAAVRDDGLAVIVLIILLGRGVDAVIVVFSDRARQVLRARLLRPRRPRRLPPRLRVQRGRSTGVSAVFSVTSVSSVWGVSVMMAVLVRANTAGPRSRRSSMASAARAGRRATISAGWNRQASRKKRTALHGSAARFICGTTKDPCRSKGPQTAGSRVARAEPPKLHSIICDSTMMMAGRKESHWSCAEATRIFRRARVFLRCPARKTGAGRQQEDADQQDVSSGWLVREGPIGAVAALRSPSSQPPRRRPGSWRVDDAQQPLSERAARPPSRRAGAPGLAFCSAS